MDTYGDVEHAQTLDTWVQGNGPWQQDGLRLRLGYHAVVPEAAGYLSLPGFHVFQAPDEGIAWRYGSIDTELFRPENALERFGLPLCEEPGVPSSGSAATPPTPPQPGPGSCFGGYKGYSVHVPRGLRGYVASLPGGVTATVRIQRIPRDAAMQYFQAVPSRKTANTRRN